MSLKESGEMYLESIYVLRKQKPQVRSIDVAEHMNFSKPSVSRAMGILREQGYILVDKDGHITLTELGQERAQKIFERHTVLAGVLVCLGVDREIAAEDACKMEHVISEESFRAVRDFFEREANRR